MKQTRWLIVSIALGVATALTIPAASLAHEVEIRPADFNGNTFSGGAYVDGPIEHFFVELFDGAFKFEGQRGRPTDGKLANAFAVRTGWDNHGDGTCSHWQEIWEAQSQFWTVNEPGPTVTFTDPYSGSMQVIYEMHGFLVTWDGLEYLPDEEDACAWEERDPDRREHLGEASLEVAATWESVVMSPGKGKKNKGQQVSTEVSFETTVFGGQPLEIVVADDPESPFARSGASRLDVAVFNHIDTH